MNYRKHRSKKKIKIIKRCKVREVFLPSLSLLPDFSSVPIDDHLKISFWFILPINFCNNRQVCIILLFFFLTEHSILYILFHNLFFSLNRKAWMSLHISILRSFSLPPHGCIDSIVWMHHGWFIHFLPFIIQLIDRYVGYLEIFKKLFDNFAKKLKNVFPTFLTL